MKFYKSVFAGTSGRICVGCGNNSPKAFVSNGGYNYYCTCDHAKLFAETLVDDPIAVLDWPGELYFETSADARKTPFAKKPNDGDKGDLPW